MASSRKPSMGSTYVSEKRISQWEELMRKFSEAHKEQCKTVSLDIPRAQRSTKFFPTGSQYEGSWDVLGMSGYGEYKFPNGVTYEGDFEDGMLSGKGELRYGESGDMVVRGKWKKGVMIERTLLFSDSLEYKEDMWKYCMMPDRRFAVEYDIDLMPAGKSFLTADQPTKKIPPGYYDTGDGFYDPKSKVIYKYDDVTAIIRAPSVREQKWIVDNCRLSPETPLGPRPDLYEKWLEPMLTLPPQPPPAAGVKAAAAIHRQQSLFEQDFDFLHDDESKANFYDSTKRVSATVGRCFENPIINFKFSSCVFANQYGPNDSHVYDTECVTSCKAKPAARSDSVTLNRQNSALLSILSDQVCYNYRTQRENQKNIKSTRKISFKNESDINMLRASGSFN